MEGYQGEGRMSSSIVRVFVVGNGTRLRISGHHWCGDEILEVNFPAHTSIPVDRGFLVSNYREGGDNVFWDIAV